MASHAPSALRYLFFTGKRVRLTPKGAAKLLVPVTVLYGLVLKLIELAGSEPRILVEFETLDGRILSGIYAPEDLEGLPVEDEEIRKDLIGRRVHFPRSSGIGISFPPDATDYAKITDAVFRGGGTVRIDLAVERDGHPDDPFTVTTDLSNCDLLLRVTGDDTG